MIRHSLNYEKTYPYVRDIIHWGTPLTKVLSEKIDFSKGHFFIDLPEGYILSRIYNFKNAGISYKLDVGAEKKLTPSGKPYTPRFYMSTQAELDYFLKRYLDLDDKNFVIIDEYCICSDGVPPPRGSRKLLTRFVNRELPREFVS